MKLNNLFYQRLHEQVEISQKSFNWKVNEKLDTELREFKNYIFQSLLEICNKELQ